MSIFGFDDYCASTSLSRLHLTEQQAPNRLKANRSLSALKEASVESCL